MKNHLLLLFALLWLGISSVNAQVSFSKVTYIAQHSFPTSSVFNGENTLHFDSLHSLFIHNNYPITNTTMQGGYYKEMNIGDEEGCPVFIDYQNNITYTKKGGELLSESLQIIKESMDTIVWKIGTEKKIIKGYSCTIATAYYEGRTYDVWFTLEIPFPFGPYRLRGLPGLILEAKSQDNKVSWEFSSFENQNIKPIKLIPPSNGRTYTWEEFVKTSIELKHKMESKYKNKPKDKAGRVKTITVLDSDPERYIEKGKFSIYSRYLDNK